MTRNTKPTITGVHIESNHLAHRDVLQLIDAITNHIHIATTEVGGVQELERKPQLNSVLQKLETTEDRIAG